MRLDNLGDVLVTTPAIRAIKQSLPTLARGVPGASLTLLASPVGAQAGRLNPDIDEVIVYEAPWMDPWHRLPQDADREQRMIATIKEREFDGAIIFTSFRQSALPAAYLCYLAGIPLRVAASIDGPGSLLTTRHKHPERMMHEVERGLDLVGAIGLGTGDLDLVLVVPEDARAGVADFLSAHQVYPHRGCRRRPLIAPLPLRSSTSVSVDLSFPLTLLINPSKGVFPMNRREQVAIEIRPERCFSIAHGIRYP